MNKPKQKAVKSSAERRAVVEQENRDAHETRVEHDRRLLARTRKVQLSLRVWPEERDALVAKAHSQGHTLNNWAVGRIFNAEEQAELLNAKQVLGDAARLFQPLLKSVDTLAKSGDFHRAVGKLLLLLKPVMDQIPGREREAIADVTREIEGCERALEADVAMGIRSLRSSERAQGAAS